MTHSLHRKGSVDTLKEDYVVLAMLARGINDDMPDAREKLIKIARIFKQNHPTNIMIEDAWKVSSVITAVYDQIENVKNVLKTLKKEKLGISIVVSGLISEIKGIADEIGLDLHTIHLSLGVFGKINLLPSEQILEITTMCGHHCISSQSVNYYVELIKKGKITIEKAAKKLSEPCVCGIFNPKRAIRILNNLIN